MWEHDDVHMGDRGTNGHYQDINLTILKRTHAKSHMWEWDREVQADCHHRVHRIACDNIQETTTGIIKFIWRNSLDAALDANRPSLIETGLPETRAK